MSTSFSFYTNLHGEGIATDDLPGKDKQQGKKAADDQLPEADSCWAQINGWLKRSPYCFHKLQYIREKEH